MVKENDVRIDTSLLHPNLRYKLNKMLKKCNEEDIYVIITEGYRTKERQDQLYSQGRFGNKGPVVTNAQGWQYQSQHQWGVAFDIAIRYIPNAYDMKYITRVATIAKDLGLSWGGDWKNPIDNPHIYLGKWGSTPDELKEIYGTFDKFKASWTGKITKKRGLWIWTTYKITRKRKMHVLCDKTVDILWKHKKWSKVNYNGVIGYTRSKYIK